MATTTATAYDTTPTTYTTTRETVAAYPAGAGGGHDGALGLLAQRLQALTEDGVSRRAAEALRQPPTSDVVGRDGD